MGRIIQMRRGLEASIPALADGEIGIATDTKHLWYGAGGNNQVASVADMNAAIATAVGAVTNTSGSGFFKDKKTGTMFQWGKVTTTANTSTSFTFPITFPDGCWGVFPVPWANFSMSVTLDAVSATGFQLYQSTNYSVDCYYLAIGS